MNTKEILQGIKNWTTSKLGGKVDKTTTVNGHALSGNVTVSKSDVGLGNVTNDAQVTRAEMGSASGVATLDTAGKVPSSQLPSYVDDVLEYDTKSAFPTTGETGKIYVDKTTNKTWRWGGTDYVEISQSLALGETSSTAYAGDKGKALADKLATIETGAEVNVQSDWNATEGDAFIKNKPTNVSAFTNDVGYLTQHQSLDNYYTKNQIDALTRHTRLIDFDLNVLKKAVADQNLEKYGLKVGDQKTINGRTYVIADLNPMKGTHSYRVNTNHVGLIVIPHTTQAWNVSGATSTGSDGRGAGYLNCDLHYYLKNTLLPLVETDLGAANLLGHRKLLSNAVTDGKASNWTWEADCKICALSEVQVYGSVVWGASGYDTGEACRQLAVFQKYSHTEIFKGEYPWLRDVVSASSAAIVGHTGIADHGAAGDAVYVSALILFH